MARQSTGTDESVRSNLQGTVVVVGLPHLFHGSRGYSLEATLEVVRYYEGCAERMKPYAQAALEVTGHYAGSAGLVKPSLEAALEEVGYHMGSAGSGQNDQEATLVAAG